MAPKIRKSLGSAAKRPRVVTDLPSDEVRSPSENSPAKKEALNVNRKHTPLPGSLEQQTREVQKMLHDIIGDLIRSLLENSNKFERNINAAFKTLNDNLEHAFKIQEQRREFYLQSSQAFVSFLNKCQVSMQKAREQEVNLAAICQQQIDMLFQDKMTEQVEFAKLKNSYETFLQTIQSWNENSFFDEQSEVQSEMAKMQENIMLACQEQDVATDGKNLESGGFEERR